MGKATDSQWTLPVQPEDKLWGLFVTGMGTDAGFKGNPAQDWRLLYLVRGAAALVAGDRREQLEAGHLVLLDAQQRVSIQPIPGKTTLTYRIDFGGSIADNWAAQGFFGSFPCVLRPGFDESLLSLIGSMAEMARMQPEDAQRLAAGILSNLLAKLEILFRNGIKGGKEQKLLMEARQLLTNPAFNRFCLDSIADEMGVSYSWFRQTFRRQAGLPPQQFRQRQRLTRACQLLADTQMPVSEIAKEIGFTSLAYFSRIFKKETGLSPSVWRQTRV